MNYSFFRALKFAFQDFGRNIWLSLVTITVLILALLSINILISFNAVSDQIIASVEDKIDVSVFFNADVSQAQINNFQTRMQSLPEVEEAVFVSKEEALASFRERHQNDQDILGALNEVEENPLVDALVIKAQSMDDYNKILSALSLAENKDLIKYQNFTDYQTIIERVNIITDKVERFSLFLTAIFAFIAVLIVFNAIRVTIYTHREEIAVMRLVGATNWFIRLPFLLESVLYALFACAISLGLIYALFAAIQPYLASFVETYNFNLIGYYNQNFLTIVGIELAAAIFLTIVSSGIAIGRYLKV